ncbi:hypothetical protein [Sphingomonas sp. PB4P5]|uniref:hypothetical protein n=1 Tax=Parasphingomonas puruogangriensis TaxID=3096155 RepID=UPI002FC5D15F
MLANWPFALPVIMLVNKRLMTMQEHAAGTGSRAMLVQSEGYPTLGPQHFTQGWNAIANLKTYINGIMRRIAIYQMRRKKSLIPTVS